MKHPKREPEEAFQEEFAFDLTPNVDAGAASRMHRNRSDRGRSGRRGKERKGAGNTGRDDVEQGPTVEGCHWSVT